MPHTGGRRHIPDRAGPVTKLPVSESGGYAARRGKGGKTVRLDFLNTVPYVCERWDDLARQDPSAAFLTEEASGISFTRQQADELSARVYGYLAGHGIGTEDFVLIRLPRDARPFIAMLGVWRAGASFTAV